MICCRPINELAGRANSDANAQIHSLRGWPDLNSPRQGRRCPARPIPRGDWVPTHWEPSSTPMPIGLGRSRNQPRTSLPKSSRRAGSRGLVGVLRPSKPRACAGQRRTQSKRYQHGRKCAITGHGHRWRLPYLESTSGFIVAAVLSPMGESNANSTSGTN